MKYQRLYLRRITIEDAPVLFKWSQDPHYQITAGLEPYQDLLAAHKGAEIYAQRPYSFAVCLLKNNQMIGLVELYERGTVPGEFLQTKDLGFMLDRDFENHGYMTEALTLLFDYAFDDLNQREIWAKTFDFNTRSQSLLERLGFVYQYTVDLSVLARYGMVHDEKYYLLKRSKWHKIKANTKA